MDLEKFPELLTMKQVSEILGVSSMTLRRWDGCQRNTKAI